jgi:tripartite-type tricarboxylate transporter receptor subunit TctC
MFIGRTVCTLALCLLLAVATRAQSFAQGAFYKGKQVTILVNFAAGGPTDVEARLFTRSIARHIAGNPLLIVRNLDGAGGMAGANYMGEVAPADGTYIGYFSSVPWIYATVPSQRRIAFDQFDFVALQPGTAIHYMRTDVKPGIKSVDQILSAENLIVGGLSRGNAKDVMMRLTLDMLGVPYKYVTAYPGSQGARMALERGEVNYYAESPAVYRTAIEPLVQAGQVIPLYYDPGYDGQSFSAPKQIQGLQIPSFLEIYRKLKGADPTGVRWESYLAALSVNNATQRLVVLPPHSPPAAMAALQQAIGAMQNDPEYVSDATKVFGYVPEYIADAGANERVRKLLNVKPAVQEFIQNYISDR